MEGEAIAERLSAHKEMSGKSGRSVCGEYFAVWLSDACVVQKRYGTIAEVGGQVLHISISGVTGTGSH